MIAAKAFVGESREDWEAVAAAVGKQPIVCVAQYARLRAAPVTPQCKSHVPLSNIVRLANSEKYVATVAGRVNQPPAYQSPLALVHPSVKSSASPVAQSTKRHRTEPAAQPSLLPPTPSTEKESGSTSKKKQKKKTNTVIVTVSDSDSSSSSSEDKAAHNVIGRQPQRSKHESKREADTQEAFVEAQAKSNDTDDSSDESQLGTDTKG